MKDYYLCDIHFHTNNSFDAFKTIKFDVNDICSILNGKAIEDNVKLICFTDHNFFSYSDYDNYFQTLSKCGVLCLPGIEINTTNKVHWIIIFNNNELSQTTENGKLKGEILEEKIDSYYKYNTSNKKKNLQEFLKQTEKAQLSPIDISEFIDLLNAIGIEYIAVPHFDKRNGGWFNHIKKNPQQLQLLDFFLKDNIIFGVESKQIKEKIKKNMLQTQEFINKYIEAFEKLDSSTSEKEKETALEEINKRQEHLNKLYKIEECLDMTSVVYGSDYHGVGDYQKENLFIMKSELSFNGLKFALLDSNSRLFSVAKYKKFLKNNNYVIDNIRIEENGCEKTINLGDGLNCIIGARGSGKTYFLSMLLGDTSKYNHINKSIKVKEISLLSHGAQLKLSNEMFDYVAQKSSNNNLFAKKANIYDLLARAPYDYKEFETQLKQNFNKDTESKTEIDLFIKKVNELISLFREVNISKNNSVDLKFIDSYNEYFKNKNENLEVYDILNNLNSFLLTSSSNKQKDVLLLNEYKSSYEAYINYLEKTFSIKEVKKYISEEQYSKFKENVTDIHQKIYINGYNLLKNNKEQIDSVQLRIASIVQKLKNEASNSQRILTDSISNFKNNIKIMIDLLRKIKIKYSELKMFSCKELVNENIYIYSQGENRLKVRIEKKFESENLEENEISEIFSNYKNIKGKDVLSKMVLSHDYGDYYISNILSSKDGRRSSFDLNIPNIIPSIFLTSDGDEEKNWIDLSPGQRSDMLLNIILLNDSNKILIIDQPEDDLDNETIFKKIVKRIRELKLKRQIILVTHNANLAITADCDYFIICQSETENKYSIINDYMESSRTYQYHSINNSENSKKTSLEIATEILDGGKDALKLRVKKIGYKDLFLD